MNEEMRKMFNAILEEIGRVEEKMDGYLERLEMEVEVLHHEVNACKLESDAVGLLIRRMDQLEQQVGRHEDRLTRLEQKQNKILSMV
ncbi:hypothetical protein NSB25_15865 [Acetatifactor muris]|uniref:Uncharacterized protein n=1 Tax=Acetatifactor muris TaxID=879566 RepID=A0A2K4ZAR5_9FIRM|nr:hypothetical protein [Acetatifactor muris]MCR2048751.1 hypothetical protein [Acetatifactor muris]SOY27543.1 hypothetical protein AMURIS_00247 [Acetatifactor muris]